MFPNRFGWRFFLFVFFICEHSKAWVQHPVLLGDGIQGEGTWWKGRGREPSPLRCHILRSTLLWMQLWLFPFSSIVSQKNLLSFHSDPVLGRGWDCWAIKIIWGLFVESSAWWARQPWQGTICSQTGHSQRPILQTLLSDILVLFCSGSNLSSLPQLELVSRVNSAMVSTWMGDNKGRLGDCYAEEDNAKQSLLIC